MIEIIGGFGSAGVTGGLGEPPRDVTADTVVTNPSFVMVLESAIVDSEADAWLDYEGVEAHFFKFVRGFKYWRKLPELQTHKDFDRQVTEYRVRARIFSVMEKLPDAPVAKIGDTFHG